MIEEALWDGLDGMVIIGHRYSNNQMCWLDNLKLSLFSSEIHLYVYLLLLNFFKGMDREDQSGF